MKTYTPQPIDTSNVELSPDLLALTEALAANTHDVWSVARLAEGYQYGPERSDEFKTHPCLVPYQDLPESEKQYDRNSAIETLKLVQVLGYKIVKNDT